MKIGTRCTVCHARVDDVEVVICETCGRGVHEPCQEYETRFECRYCADEPWIDALEF